MRYKNISFYLNIFLFIVIAIMAVNTFSPSGHEFIKWALAQIPGITGGGNVNYLSRFAGAAANDPSTQIGNSIIYDDGVGFVGIGTTAPTSTLHVSNLDASGATSVARYGGNGDFYIDGPGVLGGRFTVKHNGRVGMGTNAPGAPLEISGDGSIRRGIRLTQTTAGVSWQLNNYETIAFEGAGKFGINQVGAGARLVIDTLGNVGIGTSIPAGKLQVNGSMVLTPLTSNPGTLVNGMMWMCVNIDPSTGDCIP